MVQGLITYDVNPCEVRSAWAIMAWFEFEPAYRYHSSRIRNINALSHFKPKTQGPKAEPIENIDESGL